MLDLDTDKESVTSNMTTLYIGLERRTDSVSTKMHFGPETVKAFTQKIRKKTGELH